MQGQAWYDWLGIRLLVCGNKTKGLISLLSAQGKAHIYIVEDWEGTNLACNGQWSIPHILIS